MAIALHVMDIVTRWMALAWIIWIVFGQTIVNTIYREMVEEMKNYPANYDEEFLKSAGVKL